jgi:hypothetical protein
MHEPFVVFQKWTYRKETWVRSIRNKIDIFSNNTTESLVYFPASHLSPRTVPCTVLRTVVPRRERKFVYILTNKWNTNRGITSSMTILKLIMNEHQRPRRNGWKHIQQTTTTTTTTTHAMRGTIRRSKNNMTPPAISFTDSIWSRVTLSNR